MPKASQAGSRSKKTPDPATTPPEDPIVPERGTRVYYHALDGEEVLGTVDESYISSGRHLVNLTLPSLPGTVRPRFVTGVAYDPTGKAPNSWREA